MTYLDMRAQRAVLRGMASVIAEPSRPDSLGALLIEATGALLCEQPLEGAVRDLSSIPPDRLAVTLTGDRTRHSAAELIALAALVDGALDLSRLQVALDYAVHLGVDEP